MSYGSFACCSKSCLQLYHVNWFLFCETWGGQRHLDVFVYLVMKCRKPTLQHRTLRSPSVYHWNAQRLYTTKRNLECIFFWFSCASMDTTTWWCLWRWWWSSFRAPWVSPLSHCPEVVHQLVEVLAGGRADGQRVGQPQNPDLPEFHLQVTWGVTTRT